MAETWHSLRQDEVLERLQSSPRGLSGEEATRRLAAHGRNVLREQELKSLGALMLQQLKSVVILVLLAALVLAAVAREWPETVAIAAVVLLNALIGFFSEWRASRSIAALRAVGQAPARVRRDGQELDLPAAELVPGDLLLLRPEASVPADARILKVEVGQGRVIFGNIRKSVLFMLCTNGAEVLAVASLLGWPLPLRPLQILYLNVLTDVFPALALGVGKGDGSEMARPPRPRGELILTRRHWAAIGGWSLLIAVCVLSGLQLGLRWLGASELQAVTISFLTLGLAKLFFVFNLRDRNSGTLVNEITRNLWLWGALVFCAGLLVTAVYLPVLSSLLKTRAIELSGWGAVVALSLVPLIVGQVILAALPRRAGPRRAEPAAAQRELVSEH